MIRFYIKKKYINNNYTILTVLFIFCFILYSNSLYNNFVYDDNGIIVENNNFKEWPSNIYSFFNSNYFKISGEASYRPIATLSYYMNYSIWKLNPFGYHLFSVILHILNVVLVFFLFHRLLNNKFSAFIGTLLFAVHPVLTEAINVVTYNEDLLATFFSLVSILFYLNINRNSKKNITFYFLSLFSFLLALFSKEMAIAIPFIILFYDFLINNNAEKKEKSFSKFDKIKKIIESKYLHYSGFLLITIFYSVVRFVLLNNTDKPTFVSYGNLFERIIYFPYDIFNHIRLIILPLNLNANYVFKYPTSFFSPLNLASFAIVFLIIAVTFFIYRYNKMISFGLFWLLITLLPVSNLVEIYNPLAERYLYLPAVGFSIVVSILLVREISKIKFINKKLLFLIKYLMIFSLIVAYTAGTYYRNKVWKDDFTLWTDTTKKSPNSGRAKVNLGKCYDKQGLFDKAEEEYKKAIEIAPNYLAAHFNLGVILEKKNLLEDAINEYKTVLTIDPYYKDAHYNLGNTYEKKQFYNEAIEEYLEAIRLDSNFEKAHYNLGNIYFKKGEYEKAEIEYRKTVAINPDNYNANFNLGNVFYIQGSFNKAEDQFKKVLEKNTDDDSVYYNLGNIYFNKQMFDKSKEFYKKAIEINFSNEEAHYNLGVLYGNNGELSHAMDEWIEVTKINPNNRLAIESINKAKKILGNE